MKKFAIILTLVLALVQTQAFAAAGYNKKPAKKQAVSSTQNGSSTAVKTNDHKAYPTSGSDYLWKYNIDDLEAAPWLHDGKRVY